MAILNYKFTTSYNLNIITNHISKILLVMSPNNYTKLFKHTLLLIVIKNQLSSVTEGP